MATLQKKYFYGNEISQYGIENGKIDYATLAKTFNHVLANDLISKTHGIGEWETVSGHDYYFEKDFYQFYIVDDIETLREAGETVLENKELGLYIWAVDHCGTSWDHVLTDIEITW